MARIRIWCIAPAILFVLAGLNGTANAQPLNKDNFREYLDALESLDTEALTTRFYHEDFSIDIGEDTLDLASFLELEKSLSSLVDFHFDVDQIVADESGIAIDAIETFVVLKDADVPFIGPAQKGERWELHINVFYSLADGKISAIKPNVLSVQKIE